MSKSTQINYVGQPILKQILNLLSVIDLQGLIRKHRSDRYYKRLGSYSHLTSLLFGILSRCDSSGEICEGMRAMAGKLNHLGLDRSPAKSTFCDGNRKRSASFFESVYFALVKQYGSFLSDSRTFGLTFQEVLLVDSTTVSLFSDIMKGVGRDPKGDGKKKIGLKVHMLIDAVQNIGKFIKVTEAKVNDHQFLKELELKPYSMVVFDKAYNDYSPFAQRAKGNVYFVTHRKRDAVFTVMTELRRHNKAKGKAKVLKEELIELEYMPEEKNTGKQQVMLRRVCYLDEQNREYVFLTNIVGIKAEEVALLYKKRWTIELLFKKMKQNFQLHYFYGENEIAIRTQIWCTLIAQLLMTVLQKQAGTKKAFSIVATLVRIHLISLMDDVYELLRSTKRTVGKRTNSPPTDGQLLISW